MAEDSTDRMGPVALVTGAAAGIGRASAVGLARAGYRIVAADLDATGLEETVGLVRAEGAEVRSRVSDLADLALIPELVALCAGAYGRLDVVANVAGISGGGPIEEVGEPGWDRVHAINAKAPYFVIRAAVPLLRVSGGAVVNVASMSGLLGMDEMAAYCASKGAVVAMTRALARELAPDGIRVNCVCPGCVDTSMPRAVLAGVPEAERGPLQEAWLSRQLQRRFATPEEVAAVIVFLAGPAASFVTGLAMPVDGGQSAW